MHAVHDTLAGSSLNDSMPELGHVDPVMALEEYETNGQGGLDALLSTLDKSSEVLLMTNAACERAASVKERFQARMARQDSWLQHRDTCNQPEALNVIIPPL